MIHNLLRLTLAQNVPVALRAIPEKYHLITRLWLYGFHRPLENLRRCAFNNSIVALEYFQDFIYYAHTFYGCLLEEENLLVYQSNWVKSLDDLAQYRMVVAEFVTNKTSYSAPFTQSASLTQSAVSQAAGVSNGIAMSISTDDMEVTSVDSTKTISADSTEAVSVDATMANSMDDMKAISVDDAGAISADDTKAISADDMKAISMDDANTISNDPILLKCNSPSISIKAVRAMELLRECEK